MFEVRRVDDGEITKPKIIFLDFIFRALCAPVPNIRIANNTLLFFVSFASHSLRRGRYYDIISYTMPNCNFPILFSIGIVVAVVVGSDGGGGALWSCTLLFSVLHWVARSNGVVDFCRRGTSSVCVCVCVQFGFCRSLFQRRWYARFNHNTKAATALLKHRSEGTPSLTSVDKSEKGKIYNNTTTTITNSNNSQNFHTQFFENFAPEAFDRSPGISFVCGWFLLLQFDCCCFSMVVFTSFRYFLMYTEHIHIQIYILVFVYVSFHHHQHHHHHFRWHFSFFVVVGFFVSFCCCCVLPLMSVIAFLSFSRFGN